ncbi:MULTISPECIES: hypothetical protein [unclassified Burkholderia]|uniref:hypothetical protein n=1 Tax=unclassified Burkholderia TaxID=2613784 RepID=UPI000B0AF267|nr:MULTISPECIES: hypothetical protein [unclassified Burkholderia]
MPARHVDPVTRAVECHYDECTPPLPPKRRTGGEPAAVARRPSAGRAAPCPIAPQIVLHVAGNTRRFCVLSGAERCANDFLP